MRIGLFTDTYPPYINGVSTSVCMRKHALEKKGHQVFVEVQSCHTVDTLTVCDCLVHSVACVKDCLASVVLLV